MKKLLAVLLALTMLCVVCSCTTKQEVDDKTKSEGSLTYEQYVAAANDSDVVIEGFIQDKVYSEAYGNVNLFLQDADGAYFVYRMPCTADDNAKLVIGQKIKVTGVKTEWSGEVELKEGLSSYEIMEGNKVYDALDVTSILGNEDIVKKQNMRVAVKGAVVESAAIYNWDGSGEDGSDLYFGIKVGDASYTFVVESDLCAAGTDVYEKVKTLKVGDTVDIEGYLYWYNGVQTWVTSVTVK